MTRRLHLHWIFLVLACSGCVLQKPISESLILDQGLAPVSHTIRGGAINGPFLSSALHDHARERFEGSASDAHVMYAIGPSISLARDVGNYVRAGVSFGVVFVGADVTARMPGKIYLTLNGNTNADAEVILQRPLISQRNHVVSVGAFIRSDRNAWSYGCAGHSEGYCFGVLPDAWFRANAYGLRGLWGRRFDSFRIEGLVGMGHSPTLEAIVWTLGLGLGN